MPNTPKMTPLCQLAFKYGSDKCPQIKHHYTEVYFNLFASRTNKIKKVVEIGIGTGASLYMWRDFFPRAQIYGADINTATLFDKKRIKSIRCDQTQKKDLQNLLQETGADIDLFVDDGLHGSDAQLATCKIVLPYLITRSPKMEHLYSIEDVGKPEIIEEIKKFPFAQKCKIEFAKIPRRRKYWDDRAILARYKPPAKTSIIVLSRNERLLKKTVDEIYKNATGEIEVIVVLDGPSTFPLPQKRKTLIFIRKNKPEGIRCAINDAAAKATGQYLLKTDGHCMFAKGFDEILQRDCEDNWVLVPRRYGMDSSKPDLWKRQADFVADYYYLSFPWSRPDGGYMKAEHWISRNEARRAMMIDEIMAIHGSVWFMPAKYYRQNLGGLNEDLGSWGEHNEIVFKTWLSGGAVMIDKNTWYAHLQDKGFRKGFKVKEEEVTADNQKVLDYFGKNKWQKQIYDFQWLIDRFWPLPTLNNHQRGERYLWPENWKDVYRKWLKGKPY